MMLYLCRHAAAADVGSDGTDATRPLTAQGRHDFKRAMRGLSRLDVRLNCVLASPLTRAQQTADIMLRELGEHLPAEQSVIISASLAPPGRLDAFVSELRGLAEAAFSVAAVGHEPILSRWIGQICFDSPGRCRMKKGAIAAIEFDPHTGTGELAFLLQPGALRKL
ncbi:MAG: phosphohistidine phosphatase SixA [Phycisphaerales bacterium]|nr:phosphohistidine phosphatase SixA [Phycisphaerales bacterium]